MAEALARNVDVLSAAATAISAFLIFLQIRSDRAWDRLRASHDMLNELVSGAIESALEEFEVRFGWDILHEERTYDQVVEALRAKGEDERIGELDRQLRRLLRRLEALCISMHNGIVQEKVCREYLFSLLVRIFRQSRHFIEIERQRRRQPKVFEFLESYARRWDPAIGRR